MSVIVTLKKGEGRTVKAGGMWIYDNEIESVLGSYENGDVVLVHDFDGYPMGKGYINRHSKIRVRMLTRHQEQGIDDETCQTCMGVPQKSGRYLKLSSDLCRGRFLPGAGSRQVCGCTGGAVECIGN